MKKVLEELKKLQDKKYADFQAKLIPTIDKKSIIGVRTPELKKLAKEILAKENYEKFLDELPHKYFDENQLHTFILSEMKDFDECIKRVNDFLPYIDNWATCDQLSPKVFKKNKDELLKYINKWIKTKHAYIVRFAIKMLMSHFLDEDFDKKYLKMVENVKFKGRKVSTTTNRDIKEKISVDIDPDKYYVEMMRAWYFATAIAKQYDAALPFLINKKLNTWTHNKAIQKAVESYRVNSKNKKEIKDLMKH